MKTSKLTIIASFILILFISMFLFIKGQPGNPFYFQKEKDTRVGGPFESTNSNSRYALIEAIVDYHTFFFNNQEAAFSASDIVNYHGKYFSIFTPGVSFIGIPFYIIGSFFGIPQLTTYFLTVLITLANVFLVFLLSRKLGLNFFLSLLAGLVFLFATNSLAYALTFTQHQMSTLIILLSFLIILSKNSLRNNVLLGVLYGYSLLVDIPNGIVLLPVIFYALFRNVNLYETVSSFRLNLKPIGLFILISAVPFIMLFGWYNMTTAGSFTKIAQIIGRANFPAGKTQESQVLAKQKTVDPFDKRLPLETRIQLNGLYILLVSDERGWLYYSPIVIFGLLGLYLAYKTKENKLASITTIAVITTTIVTYSMHGDPWGGWSFGPRYLIPSSALIAPFTMVALQKYKKNVIFLLVFGAVLYYSVNIAIAGALTTNAIPPKGEALNLNIPIPYTYKYNFQLIEKNKSSSLLYNLILNKYITVKSYDIILLICILAGMAGLYGLSLLDRDTKKI